MLRSAGDDTDFRVFIFAMNKVEGGAGYDIGEASFADQKPIDRLSASQPGYPNCTDRLLKLPNQNPSTG